MKTEKGKKSPSLHWADVEESGAYWGLKFLALIYRLAGRRVCLVFMFPVLLFFYLILSSARRSINQFNKYVSDMQGHQKTGFWQGFPNFLAFGAAALDKLAAWDGDIRKDKIVFPGKMKTLFELDVDKNGAVLFVSHLGNVEVMRAIAALTEPRPITVLVHTKHAQRFNRLMARFNPASTLKLIEVTEMGPDVAVYLKNCVDRGEWVVIAADRPPVGDRSNIIWIPFLGHPAPFALGPYVLAHVLEKPVFQVACVRVGDKFVVEFAKLTDRMMLRRKDRHKSAEKWATQYAAWLEMLALKYPEQWFNFFSFWAASEDEH
ncbi:MAG: acyltransferase [Sneathiella sp.]